MGNLISDKVPNLTKKQKARQNNIVEQQPNTTRVYWKARTASEQAVKGTQHSPYTKREQQQKQSEEHFHHRPATITT
jgi:hypothetical protein